MRRCRSLFFFIFGFIPCSCNVIISCYFLFSFDILHGVAAGTSLTVGVRTTKYYINNNRKCHVHGAQMDDGTTRLLFRHTTDRCDRWSSGGGIMPSIKILSQRIHFARLGARIFTFFSIFFASPLFRFHRISDSANSII